MKFRTNAHRLTFALTAALSLSAATGASFAQRYAPASDGVSASQLSAIDKTGIEKSLSEELQKTATKIAKVPGQKKFNMSARLSAKKSLLQIDLGKDAIPDQNGADFEEQCSLFIETARPLLVGIVSVENYECTFGGKDIYFYHPEAEIPTVKKIVAPSQEDPLPLVMLSAGHGLYLDYPPGKPTAWLPQRPLPSNGITEDFITPGYVSEISSALTARGSQVAIVSRGQTPPRFIHLQASSGGRSLRNIIYRACCPLTVRTSGTPSHMKPLSCESIMKTSGRDHFTPII